MVALKLIAGCAGITCASGRFGLNFWVFLVLPTSPAGWCARQRSNFLSLRRKKVTKERASRSRRPLRCATGYAALLGLVGGPLELGLRPQTVAGPDPPSPALLADATRRGCGQPNSQQPKTQPGAAGLQPPRAQGAMWRCAPPIPIPGVPLCMRRGAQLWADQGWRCLSAASLARPRPKRAPQVPVAPAEGADSGGAFLLVTFLLRKRTSYCAAGRIPGRGLHEN